MQHSLVQFNPLVKLVLNLSIVYLKAQRKRAVITFLIKSLSPNSKKQVYESGKRSVYITLGRPKIPVEIKELLIAFLERPNIGSQDIQIQALFVIDI